MAQDEASCAIFGMPQEAIQLGAAGDILPDHAIPEYLIRQATRTLS
ncbi:MAG TPA: chemotaxis protein CheB [Stenomitos sp.]